MGIRERHFDYQITLPTVPVGGLTDLSITTDSDAPFMLRVVKSRNLGFSGWRFQDASRKWQSSGAGSTALGYRTDMIAPQTPAGVWLPSHGVVMEPQMFYPSSSLITLAVANNTNDVLTNVRVLFRGSKLYDETAFLSATYPPRLSVLPYTYQQIVPALGVVETRRDIPFTIQSDSDFAMNWGVADPWDYADPDQTAPAGTIEEVYCTLKDVTGRAYSNQPIHINDLFGQGRPTSYPSFIQPSGDSVNDPPVGCFPNRFMPSIYIPKNGTMLLDVMRNEVTGGMNTVDLYFRYGGVKVFQR